VAVLVVVVVAEAEVPAEGVAVVGAVAIVVEDIDGVGISETDRKTLRSLNQE